MNLIRESLSLLTDNVGRFYTMTFAREIKKYFFPFPESSVAQRPLLPRDHAQLLVYDRKTRKVRHDAFQHLTSYLKPGTLLILNDTKVLPARLVVQRKSGARIRLLYIKTVGKNLDVYADRELRIGDVLSIAPGYTLTVISQNERHWMLRPSFALSALPRVLNRYGTIPIPPYIKHSPLTESQRRKEYQTVFAKTPGSVAAPTASLHFTRRLLARLKKHGVLVKYVTLHVGLGTFASLTPEHMASGMLHEEYFEIPAATAKAIRDAQKESRPIIPVGTTALRTIESLPRTRGATRLFIRPGYQFKIASGLITNFHVPGSSLLMLVAALVGRTTILRIYRDAIARGYRLFSFGDGMLIR